MIDKDKFKYVSQKSFFPVVPLKNYKKVPYVKWNNEENQIKSTTEITSEIMEQSTGLSLLTGKISGVMVLDLDVGHTDKVDGIENFKQFIKDISPEAQEQIKNTFRVNTPSGGIHLYFKYKQGLKSKAGYIPGVDVRSDGGLIVLPGSIVVGRDKSKKEYLSCDINADIRELPGQLFDKLISLDKHCKENNNKINVSDSKGNGSKYYKVVEGGGRNATLISYLGHIVRNNPSMRKKDVLIQQGLMYNNMFFKPALPEQEVISVAESALRMALPDYCDEKGKVIDWKLVQTVLEKNPSYVKCHLFYMYDDDAGYYKSITENEIARLYFDYALDDLDKTARRAKNFSELLLLRTKDIKTLSDEKRYINCLNGIIDIENDRLLEHSSEYKISTQFNAKYLPGGKTFTGSQFEQFLHSTLEPDNIPVLQEAIGLMLSPHAREVQNCFIFKGSGSNGKSVLFEIMEALFRDANEHICSIGLGDFGENFVLSVAEGKHANIVRDDELSGGKSVNKWFKSICCGEPITVNKKNKDLKREEFNMTMFFGLNGLPSASDKSNGFFRRPVIIPFNHTFGTEKEVAEGTREKIKDPMIARKIIDDELDIVFMWAHEGLRRLKDNKWIITSSQEIEDEKEEYREEADSAYSFFREKIKVIPGKDKKILARDVYLKYRRWCEELDIIPMNTTQFGRQLSDYGVRRNKSHGQRYYLDIEINSFTEVEEVTPFD